MSNFNLIDEPWIPVRLLNGRHQELGIRQTLEHAAQIAAIEDGSPLVTAAVHRLLLAILYRALEGPADREEAMQMFDAGLPTAQVARYLDAWHHRFALLDKTAPFGQIAEFEPKVWRAWTVLAAEHNADNAKVLFDHIDVSAAGSISCAAAARWLVATQAFAVSCGKSQFAHTGTAPSATAAVILPLGKNLQETLLYCLVPQGRELLAKDLPHWERDPESVESLRKGVERVVQGVCDLYTWRSRSIRIDQRDAPRVAKVAFASGVGVAPSDFIDPMVAHRIDEKRGRLPIQFRERGLWRDFDCLLPDEDSELAPRVIHHALDIAQRFPHRRPIAICAMGQANDKAKIEFWRLERFAFPGSLADNRSIRFEVKQLLKDAEDAQKALWAGCRDFALNVLTRGGRREPAKQDISRLIQQMALISQYWSALEPKFHRRLAAFGAEDPVDIRDEWHREVRQTLLQAWDQHRSSMSLSDAWTVRALVKAEASVHRGLARLGWDRELKLEEQAA